MASIFVPRCPPPTFHFWPKTAKLTPGSSKILRTAARMESSSVAANAAADSATDHQDSESSVADTVVQYVVLRRDLIDTWPLGSVVTQGCHASVAAIWSNKDDAHTLLYCSPSNLDSMHKVTLEVKGEAQILNLSEKLKTAGIAHKLWIEQPENFPTCLATKPYPKSFVSSYFKKLKLCNRRSSKSPFPVSRSTTPSDGNDSGLGRLQVDLYARNRHVRWSDEMDDFMITSLVEQVLAGHKRSDNGFTSFQVAKAMERVLNGCGVTVSNKNVRARLKTLKKEHDEVRQLLNMSGFGLDPETGRIVADAVAWDDFIKGKPKFGKWRSKLYPRYDEMETIFGNDDATGQRSVSGFDHFSPINVIALMAGNRQSSTSPFPVTRSTTPSDGNDSGLGKLQVDLYARNRHVRWSDEMDGFMITSLVEQVLAGHKRIDNGFTSFQVAKAMERVLNGCGVTVSDKNVRARLKTLKKEHAEVRQLLNMSGFGLDRKTGRIVADAVAWDDFIKGKPKFGKWRSKLCPRYDEMETIFGNDAAIGERSVSDFDHFSSINVTALMAGNRQSSTSPFPVTRSTTPSDGNDSGLEKLQANLYARNRHVRRSDEMDGFMITSLVEQVSAGHKRIDNGFTSFQVAKAMERVLNGCGVTVSNKNVRARLKTLKKEHAEVRQLLNMSGFGLDRKTGRIVAEAVAWDDFIKVKPKFENWRSKLCPRYGEMETIFGNNVFTRERSVSGFDNFSPINATDESVNEVDVKNVEMDNSPVTALKRTVEEGTNKAKRQRAQPVDESTIALLRIVESSSKIAQALEMQAALDIQNHVNWQLILEKLEAMNLDMKDIMEVIKAFRSDDGLAKVFLNLTSEKYMRALVFDKLGRDPPQLR